VEVFLGLGGNVGDPAEAFRSAFRALAAFLRDARISSFYRTKPRYLEDQPPFLNAVVCGRVLLGPRELLAAVQAVEAEHGRDRSREVRKGPRTLDIDILLYGDAILDLPDLVVPHPGLPERLFALVPLLELAPGLADPRTGKPFSELAAALPDQGIYLEGEAGL
jgi:2-amino-4-hydroxy-6-hydroxymethyldihydropteridine diphosphokinase